MLEPFIGEIIAVAFNFAPEGWLPCDGQELPIASYQELHSLIGNTYGGTTSQTFKLPNLNGRVIIGRGGSFATAQPGGAEKVTLTQRQLPPHTHLAKFSPTGGVPPPELDAFDGDGTLATPNGTVPAKAKAGLGYMNQYAPLSSANTKLGRAWGGGGWQGTVTVESTGASEPVQTMPPYLPLYYIIAVRGIFPPRP